MKCSYFYKDRQFLGFSALKQLWIMFKVSDITKKLKIQIDHKKKTVLKKQTITTSFKLQKLLKMLWDKDESTTNYLL